MGDHQLSLAIESQISLTNSDYFLNYAYLKNRIDYYFTVFHQADFFFVGGYYNQYGFPVEQTARMRHYGLARWPQDPSIDLIGLMRVLCFIIWIISYLK
ncbi:MAG: hypothetical protein CM1200mP1_02530 [Candidatus Neomarinimicrobiota bacterium]|nr:MAG: hypothetical protein CM1200mP1_02530 [Candidatus Neomarinimicrobiota bacterium]